jgi:hypothetical protein
VDDIDFRLDDHVDLRQLGTEVPNTAGFAKLIAEVPDLVEY